MDASQLRVMRLPNEVIKEVGVDVLEPILKEWGVTGVRYKTSSRYINKDALLDLYSIVYHALIKLPDSYAFYYVNNYDLKTGVLWLYPRM